ncbi:MAG: hypothetical protein QM770_17275 [Tepidisphaeraceae bacterium]
MNSNDPIDDLLQQAHWPGDPGVADRLMARWADTFAYERRRVHRHRMIAVAAVAAILLFGITIVSYITRVREQPHSTLPIAITTPPIPTLSAKVTVSPLDSRPASLLERSLFELASRKRATAKSKINMRDDATVARAEPNAEQLLRSASTRRERESACDELSRVPSPAVSVQLARLLDTPDLRRDVVRTLLRRQDSVARGTLGAARRTPQLAGLVRSVESEEAARSADALTTPDIVRPHRSNPILQYQELPCSS